MLQNYSALQETHEPDEEGGVLVHVAEPSRTRWNHIIDLDSFFKRIYEYRQRHGFFCIVLKEVLELIQFVFIVFLTAYIIHGINYPVLFHDVPPPSKSSKVTLDDVVLPFWETVNNFGALTWIALIIATVVWLTKLMKVTHFIVVHCWETKQFYNRELQIADSELDNLTWHEIQTRIRAVQTEQQMCIHKRELTDLDIYHRILRQENYLVAMVNKKLLPARLNVPFLGEVVYWTAGLRLNIQLLFFWSPWSPFENPWHLKEEYKKPNLRHDLAKQFGKQILWLALANLIFAPVIFLWQLLYAFFNYAALIRKEPKLLAIRRWSLYGRLYLRHFNELEHELHARLTRAHRPASKYSAAFSSPLGTIISENIGFYATSFLAVFVGLSLVDEDVLSVEHVFPIITLLTIGVALSRSLPPEETTSLDLEDLLTKVVFHTHYLPSDWKGQAHTARVRKEFEQLFQYGFVGLLETILSPLLTPYILWKHIYPRAIEIVDFFRNFTVSVVGVGDVCSFAQMDLRKHGNPEWHDEEIAVPDQYSQCEDGKVELSLVHFKYTNPTWKPPESVQEFVKNVQNQSSSMIASLSNQQQMQESYQPYWPLEDDPLEGLPPLPPMETPFYSSDVWRTRLTPQATQPEAAQTSRIWTNEAAILSIREMALSATYLHSIHSNRTEHRVRNTAQETTPLLSNH